MPSLHERKVLSLGGESLLVTLPIGWVRFNKIRQGDLLQVEANGELRIRPKRKARQAALPLGKVRKGNGKAQA